MIKLSAFIADSQDMPSLYFKTLLDKKIVHIIVGNLTLFCFLSCAHPPAPEKIVVELKKIRKVTPNQQAAAPLPLLSELWTETYLDNVLVSSQKSALSWDFDRDGLADMVELLNDRGEITKSIYDFDRNGEPDYENSPVGNYSAQKKKNTFIEENLPVRNIEKSFAH